MKKPTLILFSAFMVWSCERVYYFPDKPLPESSTIVIAHKGGGAFDNGNTYEGCKYGLSSFDGIECDIQKGGDNVLWLSHSHNIMNCGSSSVCYSSLSKTEIVAIDSCLGKQKDFTQLGEIFQYMSQQCPDKYISLDVKAWEPCELSGFNLTREMNILAQKIIDLTTQYHLEQRVLVESETGDFLYYIKTHTSDVATYLSTFGDFEMGISRALDAGFTGISFHYKFKEEISKAQVEMIHRKGLKIQLWTISDTATFREALAIKPDFIQTDIQPERK
jgi:glycerophosphoryl diester phosphodiesterase